MLSWFDNMDDPVLESVEKGTPVTGSVDVDVTHGQVMDIKLLKTGGDACDAITLELSPDSGYDPEYKNENFDLDADGPLLEPIPWSFRDGFDRKIYYKLTNNHSIASTVNVALSFACMGLGKAEPEGA